MSKSRNKKHKHSADAHKGGGKASGTTKSTAPAGETGIVETGIVETGTDEALHEQVFSVNDASEADALMAEFAAADDAADSGAIDTAALGDTHGNASADAETIEANPAGTVSTDTVSTQAAPAEPAPADSTPTEAVSEPEPAVREERHGKRRGKLTMSGAAGKAATPVKVKLVVPTEPRAPAFVQLGEYERLSMAHVAGTPQQSDAPGHWRGVGFRLGMRRLAASFDEVVEILSMPQITHVPGAQPWMLGVANVRGTLLPVVDLKQFLEGERTVIHEAQRILVVRQTGGNVAVLIDELFGQRSFNDSQMIKADDDEGRYGYFVKQVYRVGDFDWGVFSMSMLTRTPEFRQAAA